MEYPNNTGQIEQHFYTIEQVASLLECKVSEIRSAIIENKSFFLQRTEIMETDKGILFTEQGIYKLSMFVNSSVAAENRLMMVTIGKIDRKWKNRIKAFRSDR